jgi:hypothetical protein
MGEMVKLTGGTLSPSSKVIMWEVVTAIGNNIRSDRHEVLGGWIVRTFKTDEYGSGVEQNFVSDPNHKWKMLMKKSFKPKTEDL